MKAALVPLTLSVLALSASAGSITHSRTSSLMNLDCQPAFTFPRFDSSTGILTGVRVDVSYAYEGRIGFENTGWSGATVMATLAWSHELRLGNSVLDNSASSDPLPPIDLAAYDNELDFRGPSGFLWVTSEPMQPLSQVVLGSAHHPAFVGAPGLPSTMQLSIRALGTSSVASTSKYVASTMSRRVGFRVDVRYDFQPFVASCPGDGSAGLCPCGNVGAPGRGCRNSLMFSAGARLSASGVPSLGSDSLVLSVTGLPTCLVTYFQSNTRSSPSILGDGLNCLGASIRTLSLKAASSSSSLGGNGTKISILGAVVAPGSTRHYQVHYSDPVASFCTPVGRNTTNMMQVLWSL